MSLTEALCIAMWAPNSYTKRKCGGNSKSHGGALVVRRILELALQNGASEWQSQVNFTNVLLNGRLIYHKLNL